jgi:hypothetical protein
MRTDWEIPSVIGIVENAAKVGGLDPILEAEATLINSFKNSVKPPVRTPDF